MKFYDWMSILMGLFFALSAMAMSFAQMDSSNATDKIIESLIDYQNNNIFSDSDTRTLVSNNIKLSLYNAAQINGVKGCLNLILAEKMSPFNQTLYDEIKYSCVNNTVYYFNFTEYNSSYSIDPIGDYYLKIDDIYKMRDNAKNWEFVSLAFFILGCICFILLLEHRILDNYYEKKYIGDKNE